MDPVITVGLPAVSHPAVGITDGDWTNETGGTTDLLGTFDDTGASNAAYIRGAQDAATTAGRFKLMHAAGFRHGELLERIYLRSQGPT